MTYSDFLELFSILRVIHILSSCIAKNHLKSVNLIKRDDGLSHSIDLDKKKCEITRFNELYQKTYIQNKILIKGGNINEINTKINEFLENK